MGSPAPQAKKKSRFAHVGQAALLALGLITAEAKGQSQKAPDLGTNSASLVVATADQVADTFTRKPLGSPLGTRFDTSTLPDLGTSKRQFADIGFNVSPSEARASGRISETDVRVGVAASSLSGVALEGAAATKLGKNFALSAEGTIGSKEREFMLHTGVKL